MGNTTLRLHPSTVCQIVDQGGKGYKASATSNVWVGGHTFAKPQWGNEVTPLTTGEAYFAKLWDAIMAAKNTVYIAGWWVSWDAQLKAGKHGRLFDVLLAAIRANANLKVYVMPWHSHFGSPVDVNDSEIKEVLEAINGLLDCPRIWVTPVMSRADKDGTYFSHHQKFVVIDEQIAFVGGMDLCYGRYDDATYSLVANDARREAMNRYNPCIPHLGKVNPQLVVNPDGLGAVMGLLPAQTVVFQQIRDGVFQNPEKGLTLNEKFQPRMPWQDVHVRIKGPSASDVARNFVLRWNSEGGKVKLSLPAPPAAQKGQCGVQVLRSASSKMCQAEYATLTSREKALYPVQPDGQQCEVMRAMQNLINKATSFVYIENQFFVSGFLVEHVDSFRVTGPGIFPGPDMPDGYRDDLSGPASLAKGHGVGEWYTRTDMDDQQQAPKNVICEALGRRIGAAILSGGGKEHFHVIITLPVHPEGMLNNSMVMTQVHWTMQTLVHGPFSLLNRVRRFLKAKELWKKNKNSNDWCNVLSDANDQSYKSIPIEQCREYVTLLNLRNWEKLGDRYVTEQVYPHTKMMIVDDLYAIVGSANVNDRSMLGIRDSELSVLLMDSETEKHDRDGNGKQQFARKTVRELRRAVWSKLFGITGKIRPATELKKAIDHPGSPESWKAIQKVADVNQALYEAAFNYIPRNRPLRDKSHYASIWPTWIPGTKMENVCMPFNERFWMTLQHEPAAANLTKVEGYITSLPIDWTRGENNNTGYATSVVTENNLAPEKNGVRG